MQNGLQPNQNINIINMKLIYLKLEKLELYFMFYILFRFEIV